MLAEIFTTAALILSAPVDWESNVDRIARKRFEPNCGQVDIKVRDLRSDYIGMAYPDRCVVKVDPIANTWRLFCTVAVHEYGHLAGVEHSKKRSSIMYYRITKIYWRCKR